MQDLAQRRTVAETRPRLDIALERIELVRQFPLFADLDDRALRRLGRMLRTRYLDAGRVILRRDSVVKSVFFIASGAVELRSAGQSWRLGRGEMFGQMAALMKSPRRVEVEAIAPTTLLVLDEARFRALVARSGALQEAVRASARQRGIDPDVLLMADPPRR
jgi:CPA1 family monovalent cation:H+ antiporter